MQVDREGLSDMPQHFPESEPMIEDGQIVYKPPTVYPPSDAKEIMAIDKEKFLKNPNVCPYCGTRSIELGRLEANYNYAWEHTECLICKNEWKEIYKLIDVQEI